MIKLMIYINYGDSKKQSIEEKQSSITGVSVLELTI